MISKSAIRWWFAYGLVIALLLCPQMVRTASQLNDPSSQQQAIRANIQAKSTQENDDMFAIFQKSQLSAAIRDVASLISKSSESNGPIDPKLSSAIYSIVGFLKASGISTSTMLSVVSFQSSSPSSKLKGNLLKSIMSAITNQSIQRSERDTQYKASMTGQKNTSSSADQSYSIRKKDGSASEVGARGNYTSTIPTRVTTTQSSNAPTGTRTSTAFSPSITALPDSGKALGSLQPVPPPTGGSSKAGSSSTDSTKDTVGFIFSIVAMCTVILAGLSYLGVSYWQQRRNRMQSIILSKDLPAPEDTYPPPLSSTSNWNGMPDMALGQDQDNWEQYVSSESAGAEEPGVMSPDTWTADDKDFINVQIQSSLDPSPTSPGAAP